VIEHAVRPLSAITYFVCCDISLRDEDCDIAISLYLASRGLLVVPHHRLSSYGRRAFSVAGPAIWNWLPDSLRDPAISRDSFKRLLKTFFIFSLLVYVTH